MNTISLATELSLAEQFTRDIAFYQPPPGIEAVVTGTPYLDVELMEDINIGKLQMTILVFVVIFLFLLVLSGVLAKVRYHTDSDCPDHQLELGWAAMYLLGIQYNTLTATM